MEERLQQLSDISTDETIRRREQSDRWIEAAYSPGRAILIFCLFVDFLFGPVVLMLIPALAWLIGKDILFFGFDLLFVPVLIAQATMLAIWLGIVVPILYWLILIGVGTMILGGMFWTDHRIGLELALVVSYPLPFASVSAFGLKLVLLSEPDNPQIARPVRYSLRRLFIWTFFAALVFGFLRLISIPDFYPELLVLSGLGIVTGFLCVFAMLRPGSDRYAFLWAVGASGLLGLASSIPFRPRMNQCIFWIAISALHALYLSGLLSFYRRAGYRAVWRRGYHPEPDHKLAREPVNPLAD